MKNVLTSISTAYSTLENIACVAKIVTVVLLKLFINDATPLTPLAHGQK